MTDLRALCTLPPDVDVLVTDSGAGIRPREDSPGLGLGLGLISALTTRVDFVSGGDGTEVHMAWFDIGSQRNFKRPF